MKFIGWVQALLLSWGLTWLDLLVLAVGVVLLVWLYTSGRKRVIRQLIRALVVEAEKEFGSGTGKIKFEMVLSRIRQKLPLVLRAFITEERLKEWIEDAVQWMKDTLAENDANLLGVAQEALAQGAANPAVVVGESSGPVE